MKAGQRVTVTTCFDAPGIVLEQCEHGYTVAYKRFGVWTIETFMAEALKSEPRGALAWIKQRLRGKDPEQPTCVARPIEGSQLPSGVNLPPQR